MRDQIKDEEIKIIYYNISYICISDQMKYHVDTRGGKRETKILRDYRKRSSVKKKKERKIKKIERTIVD